jgi:transcriptional regulator with XRE-family HTH domain
MRKTLRTPRQLQLQQLLVDARTARHLTQVEVARRLGRRQPFVAKYESGERRLDVVEFCEVMRALETDPIALLAELLRREPLTPKS